MEERTAVTQMQKENSSDYLPDRLCPIQTRGRKNPTCERIKKEAQTSGKEHPLPVDET